VPLTDGASESEMGNIVSTVSALAQAAPYPTDMGLFRGFPQLSASAGQFLPIGCIIRSETTLMVTLSETQRQVLEAESGRPVPQGLRI
jgi:hypothetical protein